MASLPADSTAVLLLLLLLLRQADVVNRGMSGWNSRWARRALPTTLQQLIPAVDYDKEAQKAAALVACGAPWLPRLQLLVIWFGANDATLPTGKE